MRTISDPAWVKCGRADALVDSSKRTRFFEGVLEPLLAISQEHRDALYAWELINEPDWITNGWHPDRRNNHPIGEASMKAFLDDGKQRIRRAGFKPTIGFALLATLERSRITAEINQFHHYPAGDRRLVPHTFSAEFPGIVGEFVMAETDIWPELAAADQSVLARLRRIEALGNRAGVAVVLPHEGHTYALVAVGRAAGTSVHQRSTSADDVSRSACGRRHAGGSRVAMCAHRIQTAVACGVATLVHTSPAPRATTPPVASPSSGARGPAGPRSPAASQSNSAPASVARTRPLTTRKTFGVSRRSWEGSRARKAPLALMTMSCAMSRP